MVQVHVKQIVTKQDFEYEVENIYEAAELNGFELLADNSRWPDIYIVLTKDDPVPPPEFVDTSGVRDSRKDRGGVIGTDELTPEEAWKIKLVLEDKFGDKPGMMSTTKAGVILAVLFIIVLFLTYYFG